MLVFILVYGHLLLAELRNYFEATHLEKDKNSVLENKLVFFRVDDLENLHEKLSVLLLLIVKV